MRTDIIWAELHSPIFLAGTNLQQKLDPSKRDGLKMEYDEERKQLYVSYNGKTARVPEPSILSMIEGKQADAKPEANQHPTQAVGKFTAQVESPQSHVFAGKGGGKTGVSTKATK